MLKEEWRDIKGYEGRYQVSNLGRVKSLNYHRENREKVLGPSMDKDGYLLVLLYKNGNRKQYRVHRLVAETFLTNECNLPCINHKDENKQNNKVSNLEYCTIGYNNTYSKAVEVEQYDTNNRLIKVWSSIKEAGESTGINANNISACCRGYGRAKTAGGYIWKYKEV